MTNKARIKAVSILSILYGMIFVAGTLTVAHMPSGVFPAILVPLSICGAFYLGSMIREWA